MTQNLVRLPCTLSGFIPTRYKARRLTAVAVNRRIALSFSP